MRYEILNQRGPLTVVTTAALVGLYALYGMVMGALIQPPQFRKLEAAAPGPIKVPTKAIEREDERMASVHLAEHGWAAKAPFKFRTADAFLYWNDCEIAETQDSVEFQPFAMIWLQKDAKPGDAPVTIVAEKAYMKFSSKFDIGAPNPSHVVEGAFRGNVEIRGPDNLHVVSRNFNFSEKDMLIFSAEHVRFAQGPHRGEGQGVEIYLARDPSVAAGKKLAIAGVDSILLRKEVKLEMQFEQPPAPDGKAAAQTAAANAPPSVNEPMHVHVQSAGSFRFSVKDSIATFEKDVVVLHPDPKQPDLYDRMLCDLLTLVFEKVETDTEPAESMDAAPPAAADPAPVEVAEAAKASVPAVESTALGSLGGVGGNLSFRKLTATGKEVVLISEGNQMHAQMAQLDYDVVQRLISLKDSEAVVVTQGTSKMQCPEITLVHSEDGRVSHVWCRGAGWLKQDDPATRQIQFAARWKKQLRKFPEKDSNFDIIEIDTQALVEQPAEGFKLAAEFIKLWVDPNGTAAGLPSTMADTQTAGQFRPDRLLAEDNVAFGTSKMIGQTKELQVWFQQPSAVPTGPALGAPPQSRLHILDGGSGVAARHPRLQLASLRTENPTTRRRRARPSLPAQYSVPVESAGANEPPPQQLSQPALDPAFPAQPPADVATDPFVPAPPRQPAAAGADLGETLPVEVFADLIRIRVLQGESQKTSSVAEVWTHGNVRVAQPQPAKGTKRELRGDWLHIENKSEEDQVLRVIGSNASIRDGAMVIEGPDISFDRNRNLVTVTGAGTLEMPVTKSPDGKPLATPQKLDVWWKERMAFDGKSANFFGNVKSIMDASTMNCAQMEVVLTKPVSFSEGSGQDDADVALIICKDGVKFESKQMEDNVLTAFHKGKCANFTLDQQTGKTTAQGPGEISSWRRGGTGRPGLAPSERVRSNAPLKSASDKWEYSCVTFAGKMSGNMNRGFTTFHERVHIVYGPVDRPSVVLDPDDLPKDGGEMRSDTLELIQHKDADATDAYIEAFARGNVKLNGQTFQAQADSVSYDESKGFYILRGEGNRDATLYRQVQIGGERNQFDAKELHYNPTTFSCKAVGVSGAFGAN